jgi:hypothetical protein
MAYVKGELLLLRAGVGTTKMVEEAIDKTVDASVGYARGSDAHLDFYLFAFGKGRKKLNRVIEIYEHHRQQLSLQDGTEMTIWKFYHLKDARGAFNECTKTRVNCGVVHNSC